MTIDLLEALRHKVHLCQIFEKLHICSEPVQSDQVYPGNLLNTYHWRPLGVDSVEVWRGWYSVNGEASEVVRQLAAQDRETTVEEDIRLVESVQRGLGSRGYSPGPLVIDPRFGVDSEHSIEVLQSWMRSAVEVA